MRDNSFFILWEDLSCLLLYATVFLCSLHALDSSDLEALMSACHLSVVSNFCGVEMRF